MDHKKGISRKSNLHSRIEAKKPGAGAVMTISIKTLTVPMIQSRVLSISLCSSSLRALEHSNFVDRPRSAYQSLLFPFSSTTTQNAFLDPNLLKEHLICHRPYSPIPQLAPPSSTTVRATPTLAPISSTLSGTSYTVFLFDDISIDETCEGGLLDNLRGH